MSSETAAPPPPPPAPAPPPAPETKDTNNVSNMNILVLIFLGIFILVCIYCLVKSIMCFGKSGSTAEKIFGVVIAFFTGPFYLLYLNFNEGYCKDEEVVPPPLPPQMVGGRRK